MMIRVCVSAALLMAASHAVAQNAAEPTQPQASEPTAEERAIQQAATAFGQCVASGVSTVAATVTPEDGAASVLDGCAAQLRQLEQAAEAMIATLPAERQADARERVRTRLAETRTQIAAAIQQQREAAPESAE